MSTTGSPAPPTVTHTDSAGARAIANARDVSASSSAARSHIGHSAGRRRRTTVSPTSATVPTSRTQVGICTNTPNPAINNRRGKRPNATAARNLERSEEHTSELQSPCNLVCRLLLEKKKKKKHKQSTE